MMDRLTDTEFHARYPGVVAMSSNGTVGSALTRHQYIWWDHAQQRYIVERR